MPGPGALKLPEMSAESSCCTFVDQQDVLGLWVPSGGRPPSQHERGTATKALVVHMQVRSNPPAE
jgi:hypothetical protein